jgi:hypothetical protein
MNTSSQSIQLAHRWASPVVRTFFIGVMTFISVISTAGRAFWATSFAPDDPPLPLWTDLLLYSLGILFIVLWVRSVLVGFRDARTRFISVGIVRPMWFQKEFIAWSEITNVTITSVNVTLTTSVITFGLAFESFRNPERLLAIIQEHVPVTTPITDLRKP